MKKLTTLISGTAGSALSWTASLGAVAAQAASPETAAASTQSTRPWGVPARGPRPSVMSSTGPPSTRTSGGALVSSNPLDAAKTGYEFRTGYVEARISFPGNGKVLHNFHQHRVRESLHREGRLREGLDVAASRQVRGDADHPPL